MCGPAMMAWDYHLHVSIQSGAAMAGCKRTYGPTATEDQSLHPTVWMWIKIDSRCVAFLVLKFLISVMARCCVLVLMIGCEVRAANSEVLLGRAWTESLVLRCSICIVLWASMPTLAGVESLGNCNPLRRRSPLGDLIHIILIGGALVSRRMEEMDFTLR